MVYEDDDDFLMGTPQSKFFDILFHANRELVKNKLLQCIDRYNAMELLLEKTLGEAVLEEQIQGTLLGNPDAILERNNNLFIALMGDILSQNE
ncbi:DUF2018 family protein [Sulfurospirillum barnesii]|uniref:DUF2018 domain-containing protein n=1 Tax=Sulfurospirillum barnesii (strain ATCC 700032 / DSM 10660 / SES-3) TaxID=760154 RepID=I3XXK5_SULBS|nr:DUF2018 family protein [Sulfurospirillum barnesii]AFL68679.1 protein of unknown function (DUF2018) [Sulfurospirillum barnesii SES-3]